MPADSALRHALYLIHVFLLMAAVACSPTVSEVPQPVHSERPPIALEQSGAGSLWRALDHLEEGSFQLPPHNLPDGEVSSGRYLLAEGWKKSRSARGYTLYEHALPVDLPPKRYRKAPAGLELRAQGRVLDYVRDLDRFEQPREGWAVISETLYLASETAPDEMDPPAELHHPALLDQQKRLAFGLSGLTPREFVPMSVTVGRETRSCLLLPAPGEVSWNLDMPASPKLQFGFGLREKADKSLPDSDGVRLEVRIGQERVWQATADPGDDFEDVEISLEKWAGQQVRLSLVSDPDGNALNDLALFSAPTLFGAPPGDVRRVVVIGIDTMRVDHIGTHGYSRPTSPEMDALAAGAYVFERAYAPAPRTKPSFRTAFTGSNPLPAVHAPTFGQVLHEAGFATGGLSANVHLVPRFGFNDGFETWHYKNGAKAEDQVDRAIAWLSRHAERDSFLFMHIMDPHIFYDAPGRYKNMFVQQRPGGKFPKRFNRWELDRLKKAGDLGATEKTYVQDRYDGELRYASAQMGRLFECIDGLPGKSLLIVHTDHGEEFWDHGGFEHNHTLYDELVRAILWIRPSGGWKGGPHRIDSQVSLADLAPTLYDLVGIPRQDWPQTDGVSLRPLLDPQAGSAEAQLTQSLAERPLHIGYLMYDTERWAVVHERGKYILHTISGQEELYDLQQDPGETRNLAQDRADQLPAWRRRLAQATGWPVGLGWRVGLRAKKDAPLRIELPVRVAAAGVFDPEAARKRRANLEWGESPAKLPSEVAEVTLSEEGTVITVQPGSKPRGDLYILFGDEAPAGGAVIVGDSRSELGADPGMVMIGGYRMEFKPGAIIVPQDSMSDRVARTMADEESLEALRALGYVE